MVMKILQIVGGKHSGLFVNEGLDSYGSLVETDWVDLDADLYHWTKGLRPVQVLLIKCD